MRKLKEPERSSSSSNTNCSKMTTCGGNEFVSMPHEIPTRILEAHNELHMFRNKDPAGSDNDSALSSAPPSLSPQPNSPPDVWQTYNTKEVVCHGSLQKEIDFLQRENDALNVQLCASREKIRELEKALIVTQNGNHTQHLMEKIRLLEQKESELHKEAYELKEQNELLEFRIVELEESHDKWSLRSNSTPDTRDVWTDTEKEHDDLMMSERSDSGVTSPHSHHQLDDRTSLPSPCDLSMIDSIPNDDVRKRIIAMTKRPCYDDDDKLCLLQILSLLNNLEALSQDQEITGEFLSLDANQSRRSGSTENYSVLTEETPNRLKNQARIVATVQPYSSGLDSEEPIKPRFTSPPNTPETCGKRGKNLSTSTLQESGVFDTDPSDAVTQSTQTSPEDFPVYEARSGDLTAEIQKLNKFRERIEECVTAKKSSVVNLLSPEQKRLQYYKERLELLENKILVYESSGDLQVRRLAERLQREIHLEALVKQLSGKLEELEKENRIIDEERCEFEEAENDTRLRLQRLEVEFEILNQRNIELEMSREALQLKLKDTQRHVVAMEDQIEEYHAKFEEVESAKNNLSSVMEQIQKAMPVLFLYHEYQLKQGIADAVPIPKIGNSDGISCSSASSGESTNGGSSSTEKELRLKVCELTNRVKELEKGIDELKLAYNETLENADNLWAQMEKDYKDRLQQMQVNEQNMKVKIGQLEERIVKDSQYAQERMGQMEDSEFALKNQICKLNRENKELLKKYTALVEEYNVLKEDCQNLKNYLEGPAAVVLDKERSKVKTLEEDLNHSQQILKSLEAMHKNDATTLRSQVTKAKKELEHVKVTNHELHEEVATLETRLREMRRIKSADDETIKSLSQELRAKQIQLNNLQQMIKHGSPPTLAQELGNKRICLGDPKPLKKATFELQNSIKSFEGCKNCSSANPQVADVCKGVKRLANSLLEDAEPGKAPSKTDEVSKFGGPESLGMLGKAPLVLQAHVSSRNCFSSTEILYYKSPMKNSQSIEDTNNSRTSAIEGILGGILGEDESLSHRSSPQFSQLSPKLFTDGTNDMGGEEMGVMGEGEKQQVLQTKDKSGESCKSLPNLMSSRSSNASLISGILSNLLNIRRKHTFKSSSDVSYFGVLFPTKTSLVCQTASTIGSGVPHLRDGVNIPTKVGSVPIKDLRHVEQCPSRQKILQSFHDNEESVSKEPENINRVINDTAEKDLCTFVSREISPGNSYSKLSGHSVQHVEEVCKSNTVGRKDEQKINKDSQMNGILKETAVKNVIDPENISGEALQEVLVAKEVFEIDGERKASSEKIKDSNKRTKTLENASETQKDSTEEIANNPTPEVKNKEIFETINTEQKEPNKVLKESQEVDPFSGYSLENFNQKSNEQGDEKMSTIASERTSCSNDNQSSFPYSPSSRSEAMYTAREELSTPAASQKNPPDEKIHENLSAKSETPKSSKSTPGSVSESSKEWFFGDKAKFHYSLFEGKKKVTVTAENEDNIKKMTEEIISSVIECLSKCPSGNNSDEVSNKLKEIYLQNDQEGLGMPSDDDQLITLSEILNIKRELFEMQEKLPQTDSIFEVVRTLACLIRDERCKHFCGMKIRQLTKIVRILVDGWRKGLNAEKGDAGLMAKEEFSEGSTSARGHSSTMGKTTIVHKSSGESHHALTSTDMDVLWETFSEISQIKDKSSGEGHPSKYIVDLENNLSVLTDFIDQLEAKDQKIKGKKSLSSIDNLRKSLKESKKLSGSFRSGRSKRRADHLHGFSPKMSLRSSNDERPVEEMLESARSYIHSFYDALDDHSRRNFQDTYRNISSALEALRSMTNRTSSDSSPGHFRF
ncbi:uncharacterized protein LOC129792975 isoform X2 [Lutzomyia longipalpis]|nr:uncharacterized protein LOC129792975 isoform X2 [Lutzomyia longipalpis]